MIRPVHEVSAHRGAPTQTEDERVHAALGLVRDSACRGLTVVELAAALGTSRSALEKTFRRRLGSSPHTEIVSFRIGRAKRLLIDTSHVVHEIAAMAGFSRVAYFVVRFKRDTGYTPGAFRAKYGRPPPNSSATGDESTIVLRVGQDPAGIDDLGRSKRLLLGTPLTVGEIAGMVGFSHRSDFVTRFKKQTGYTPGLYRKVFRCSDATDGVPPMAEAAGSCRDWAGAPRFRHGPVVTASGKAE